MIVHSWFSLGFPEIIYQRSLLIELEKAGLSAKLRWTGMYQEEVLLGKRKLHADCFGRVESAKLIR